MNFMKWLCLVWGIVSIAIGVMVEIGSMYGVKDCNFWQGFSIFIAGIILLKIL